MAYHYTAYATHTNIKDMHVFTTTVCVNSALSLMNVYTVLLQKL